MSHPSIQAHVFVSSISSHGLYEKNTQAIGFGQAMSGPSPIQQKSVGQVHGSTGKAINLKRQPAKDPGWHLLKISQRQQQAIKPPGWQLNVGVDQRLKLILQTFVALCA